MKTAVDINTGRETYIQPYGRFAHCPTIYPDGALDLSYTVPWWKDAKYVIG